jgi:hypothetical protein
MRILALALALFAIGVGGLLSIVALAETPLVEIYVGGQDR